MTILEKFQEVHEGHIWPQCEFHYITEEGGIRYSRKTKAVETGFQFVSAENGNDWTENEIEAPKDGQKIGIAMTEALVVRNSNTERVEKKYHWFLDSILTRLVVDRLEMLTPIHIDRKENVDEHTATTTAYTYARFSDKTEKVKKLSYSK